MILFEMPQIRIMTLRSAHSVSEGPDAAEASNEFLMVWDPVTPANMQDNRSVQEEADTIVENVDEIESMESLTESASPFTVPAEGAPREDVPQRTSIIGNDLAQDPSQSDEISREPAEHSFSHGERPNNEAAILTSPTSNLKEVGRDHVQEQADVSTKMAQEKNAPSGLRDGALHAEHRRLPQSTSQIAASLDASVVSAQLRQIGDTVVAPVAPVRLREIVTLGVPEDVLAQRNSPTLKALETSVLKSAIPSASSAALAVSHPSGRGHSTSQIVTAAASPNLTAVTRLAEGTVPAAQPFGVEAMGLNIGSDVNTDGVRESSGAPSTTPLTPVTGATVSHMAPRVTPAVVAQQIATSTAQAISASTQIILNPEELGSVRISLTTGDAGLVVNIIAERLETTDLLRRNIDSLMQEFETLGYENPSFSFDGEGEDRGDDPNSIERTVDTSTATETHSTPSQGTGPTVVLGGLDIKL